MRTKKNIKSLNLWETAKKRTQENLEKSGGKMRVINSNTNKEKDREKE